MVRQSSCTLSNISIDYLVKNGFNIYVEYNDQEFDWTASKDDLQLYASDPSCLVALYMIREEWAGKKPIPNYQKELIHGNVINEFYKEEVIQ